MCRRKDEMPTQATRERRSGEETRALILRAAALEFGRHGYDAATLEDIAGHLGVTRSAVLHHFPSKAEIVRAIVARPAVEAWDRMLDAAELQAPLTTRQRHELLARMVDVTLEYREAGVILGHDITARPALERVLLGHRDRDRAQVLLAASSAPRDRLRAAAAIGVLMHTIVGAVGPGTALVDFDEVTYLREVVIECAVAALAPGGREESMPPSEAEPR